MKDVLAHSGPSGIDVFGKEDMVEIIRRSHSETLRAVLGYQKWASHETDPEIIELLLRNGREETKHAERIKKAIKILASAEAAQ